MKKSLIFWFAAVTCAAWILVGCESPTNGESGAPGSAGPATLPANAKPELLEAYFASTDKVFLVADLDAGTFVVPAGKTLAVVGDVELNNAPVIDAYDGTLDVALGTIDGKNTAVVIVAPAVEAAVKLKVSNASVPAYVASIPETITPITEDTLLGSLALGGEGTSVADLVNFAGAYTVYVKGNLAIDAAAPLNTGNAKLVALGGATAKGALTAGPNTKLGNLTASGALTLTGVSRADKLDTAAFTVTSTDTAVDLDSLDSGTDGKLSLTGAVTAVTISGGTGNVQFTVNTGTITALSLENTGAIAFNHADAPLSIPSAVQAVFGGNVTLAGGISTGAASSTSTITFKGDVTLGDGKAITIAETTASAVTLKAGKSIFAGATKLVTAATDTAFTAADDGAVLTFTAATGLALSAQGVEFDGDVVFYGDLTLTAVPATFGGTAYFQNAKKITLTTDASTITLTDNTGALAVGAPVTGVPDIYSTILKADEGADAVLKPETNTTLTFTETGKVLTQGASGDNAHGITLKSGAATLISGSSYVVASAENKVGTLALDSGTVLTLGGEILTPHPGTAPTHTSPKIVLTAHTSAGAILGNQGKVVAGGTEITGGNESGTWTAGGAAGTVTIEADKITGSADDVALTAGGNAAAAITVAAGETLTVDGVAVTVVSSYGKVVLTGASEGGGSLLLKGGTNPGSLVVDSSKSTPVTSITALTIQVGSGSTATDAAVTGTVDSGIVVTAASATPTTASLLGSIGGGTAAGTNDATISAPSSANDTTIANGAYVKAADE